MPAPVHVIGSLMIDRFVRVSKFPRAGETVAAQSVQIFPGGKGANQAVAAARCGAAVRMCGRTGADGRFIVDALQAAGVETAGIRTDDAMSGMAIVTITESGENAIMVAREANARLERSDIEQFLATCERGSYLLLQNECSELALCISMACERGMKVWLNAAPADEHVRAIDFTQLDGLCVNETEAESLTGEHDPERALAALAARVPHGAVVMTLGAAGAIARSSAGRAAHAGYAVKVIDTVGCGDAFIGASIVALAEGGSMQDALAWGNAAGALAAQRSGAMPSLPLRADVMALAKQPARVVS